MESVGHHVTKILPFTKSFMISTELTPLPNLWNLLSSTHVDFFIFVHRNNFGD